MICPSASEIIFDGITIRSKRPGMRRDLPTKLYDGVAGITRVGPIPGASAQNR